MDGYNTRDTLIARMILQHDDVSWEEFVHYYRNYIFSVIGRMGVKNHDVEDFAQNILLTLWKKLPDFEYRPDQCRFRTWMNTVIRNDVMRYSRNSNRYQNRVDSLDCAETETVPEINIIAEEEWKLHLYNMAWDKIKNKFSDKTRGCFQMFMDGDEIDEICRTMDVKKNTAYIYRKKVLETLYHVIKDLDEQLG